MPAKHQDTTCLAAAEVQSSTQETIHTATPTSEDCLHVHLLQAPAASEGCPPGLMPHLDGLDAPNVSSSTAEAEGLTAAAQEGSLGPE